MSYKSLIFQIQGVSPLLMHNGRLANPLDEFAIAIKKISSKRTKTEEDFIEMAHLEWLGSLYLRDKKPCLPGWVVEAGLIVAARKNKRGRQMKAGMLVPNDAPLIYDGLTDPEKLWADERFRLSCLAVVNQHRILRTHPKFDDWQAKITVQYNPSLLNDSDIKDAMKILGEEVGLGDWRPRFGRFVVVESF